MNRSRPRSAGRVPMLGREMEWSRLGEALDEVRAGGFRSVFVQGEAGIGKTRLVEELMTAAATSGFATFGGRAEDLERMRPFGAIANGIEAFAREHRQRGSRLEQVVKPSSQPPTPMEVIDAFVEFVEEMAVSRPTCVVLEDLHWADPDTIAAARGLTRRLAYLPILFVGTHRPHPLSSELVRLIEATTAEGGMVVEVNPLDGDAVNSLVRELVGAAVGPKLAAMTQAASGNPLFASELTRALLEGGTVRIEGGTADAEMTELPPTLRLTILRRLSQFSSDVVDLLKIAAILGSSFSLHELAATASKPVAEVARTLEGPIAAKVIGERDTRLAFRHDLIHEAIYEDIPAPIRASMHVEAMRTLRDLGAPGVRIAEHMIRGIDLRDPALFDEAVALTTELRFRAPRVTIALAEKALALDVPEQRRDELRRFILWPLVAIGRREEAERLGEQMLLRPQDPTVEGITRLVLAVVVSEDGRSRDAAEAIERLVEDVRYPPAVVRLVRLSRDGLLMRAGIFDHIANLEPLMAEAREADDRLALTIAMGASSLALLSQGRVADGVRRAAEYMQMEEPFRSLVPTPHLAPALAYAAADRLSDARQACSEGIRRASEAGEVPALAAYEAFDAHFAFLGGAWDEASALAESVFELVEHGSGSAIGLVLAHATLGQISLRRGRLDEAWRNINASERMVSEKGPQWGMDLIGWTKALCIEASGRPAQALDAFLRGWESAAKGRYVFARPAFPDLVRLAVAAGDRDGAAEATEEAEEGGRRAGDVSSAVGAGLRCRGILQDDTDLLVAAVEAYRKTPRVLETALACEGAARALARRGRESEARSFFNEALTVFDDLGGAQDSARALGAMRSAGIRKGSRGPRRRPATGWEALTPAELQVARLTVEGQTNPQIAEHLFVSKYTVQTHLASVFRKLGISSRVALAALAAEKLIAHDRA